jgi:citrate lyase subunit beta/citryl-CoA lyase
MMRSKLFVPGSRPEFFEKAMRSAADALTFDLEDAVAPAQKPAARRAIGDFLGRLGRGHDKLTIVRTNAVDHAGFAEDVDAAVSANLDYISLPKLESADEVRRAVRTIAAAEKRKRLDRPIGILATVESPRGLRLAYEITSADPRVAALQVGLADLFAPLRIERHAAALGPVRFAIKMAAAEAGVPAYDTVWTDVNDRAGYERDARDALAMGFLGKSCIHPSQVDLANRVFTPPENEIAWAQKVLAAAELPENVDKGAFTVDGRMVDEPFFREARATIALARRLKLVS